MKNQKILDNLLINQESHAAKLFLVLFYFVYIGYDIFYHLLSEWNNVNAKDANLIWGNVLIYIVLGLLLFVAVYYFRSNRPHYIKYIYFSVYMLTVFILELIKMGYYYSSIVEVFFVLITPIFMNKRFYWIVVSGSLLKYLIQGFLFHSNDFLFPVSLIVLFAAVTYIFINRLMQYVNAIKDRYDEKIDELTIDATYKAVNLGTGILNHMIKNEALKISMSVNLLKSEVNEHDHRPNKYLKIIQDSADHMIDMVSRIHSQMQDIELEQKPNDLSKLLFSALELNQLFIESKQITIHTLFNHKLKVSCDATYVQEVFNNIIKNAIEAMEPGGCLKIQSHKSPKYTTIIFSDNGSGIPQEHLPHVLEPFYTTKDFGHNFGLGLSFCHNVMIKSGGSMQIRSQENAGTEVVLNFSNK